MVLSGQLGETTQGIRPDHSPSLHSQLYGRCITDRNNHHCFTRARIYWLRITYRYLCRQTIADGWRKTADFRFLMVLVPIIALLVDYVILGYSWLETELSLFYDGLLQDYVLFLLSCLMTWGVLIRRPIPAGFLTLVTAFGIHFISSLLNIQRWTPSGLLVEAQKLMPSVTPSLLIPIAVTALIIVFMTVLTLSRLRNLEWNVRAAQ